MARAIVGRDHQLEAMGVAALLAHIGGEVSENARGALEQLARGFDLDRNAVEKAISDAKASLRQ